MIVIPPKHGFERPFSGVARAQITAGPLRYGALKVPLLRPRLPRLPSRLGVPTRPLLWRALLWIGFGTGALALILGGEPAHHRLVEPRDPVDSVVSVDSIEAWLRHMTVTRVVPSPPAPLDRPEGS